jgi:hypothetical protein
MPGGVRGWTELLGRWFLDALREADRDAACEDLVRLLSYSLQAADGAWTADYVHMRFKAVLPKRGA